MPQLRWFVVSENLAVDQATGRVTSFGILDRIIPVKFPAFLLKMCMAGSWDCTGADLEQDYQVAVFIIAPGDKEGKTIRTNLKEINEKGQQIMVLELGFVPILEAGEITIEVRLNDISCQAYKIKVLPADPNSGDESLFYPEATDENEAQEIVKSN